MARLARREAVPRKGQAPVGRVSSRPLAFFRETWAELRKVTWPSPQDTRKLTIVVVVVSSAVGALLGLVDWLFSVIISQVITR